MLLAVAAGASRVDEVSMLLGVPVEEVRAAVERLEGEGLLRVVERRRLLFWREERLELTRRGEALLPLARGVVAFSAPATQAQVLGDEALVLAGLAALAAEAAALLLDALLAPLPEAGEGLDGEKRSPIVFDPEEWK